LAARQRAGMSIPAPKGLILVGGLGTQLRPLTLSKPKALIEFGNKPLLLHFIEALVRAGVNEVVLAINYRAEIMRGFLDEYQDRFGIQITCMQEDEPLGTAGPIALAHERGLLGDSEPFFVINCDVACDFNLRSLYTLHKAHGKLGTIMVTRVDQPAKYGKSVVQAHTTGLIERFVEHGRTFAGDLINAGVYIFSPSLVERLRVVRAVSMEREVLPQLASEQQLYSMALEGYWMNVKQPRDFLQGHALYLQYLSRVAADQLTGAACSQLHGGTEVQGSVLVDKSAQIGANCLIGPDVSVGPGCVVEEGVRLARCILLRNVRVAAHSTVLDSILGWESSVGCWTRIEGVTVLGEDVHVGGEIFINGGLVLPHKRIKESISEPQIIL